MNWLAQTHACERLAAPGASALLCDTSLHFFVTGRKPPAQGYGLCLGGFDRALHAHFFANTQHRIDDQGGRARLSPFTDAGRNHELGELVPERRYLKTGDLFALTDLDSSGLAVVLGNRNFGMRLQRFNSFVIHGSWSGFQDHDGDIVTSGL